MGVAASGFTYLVALAAALVAGRAVSEAVSGAVGGSLVRALVVVAVADLAATGVVFVASVLARNSSMYDPYWSLQPAAVAVYYVWLRAADGASVGAAATGPGLADGLGARELMVLILVVLYSLRLTSNFFRDWPGLSKEDFRYVGFRRRFGRSYWLVSFLGIHLFPTIMVYLGCLPLYGAIAGSSAPLGWLDLPAAGTTFGAIVLAFAADGQLRRFRREPANQGRVIRSGLWSRSRHPNYLGEVTTWWGLYLFALAAGLEWWWTGIGAVAMTFLFVFASIPMMERRALATRPGYADYMACTPRLLPGRRCAGGRSEARPADS